MENKICLNCQTALPENPAFCPHCGQKNTAVKFSFWQMLNDFFDNVFNLNSKTFITFFALFIPGKLTEKYFEGKRKSYANPIRVFVVTSLALMAVTLNFYKSTESKHDNNIQERIAATEYSAKLDSAIMISKQKLKTPEMNSAFDTLSSVWQSKWHTDKDSITIKGIFFADSLNKKVALLDLKQLSVDEIIEKYQIHSEHYFDQIFIKQMITITKESGAVNSYFNYIMGKLSWVLFALVPIIAFIFKVLYIRRRRYYVEHLVFNFHTHSFIFLFIALMVLLEPVLNETIFNILIAGAFLYVPLAIKRYYKQGWGKTLVKSVLLGFGYMLSVTVVAVVFLIVSFFLF